MFSIFSKQIRIDTSSGGDQEVEAIPPKKVVLLSVQQESAVWEGESVN